MKEINNVKSIGVLSDSHIPTRAKKLPESVFKLLENVDIIIHCGDITTQDVISGLNSIAPVYPVKGNMDRDDVIFPSELIFRINNRFIFCITHGSGDPFGLKQRLYKKFLTYKPDVIIFGHSHIPENTKYNETLMFNPGSCTQGFKGNSAGIISLSDDKITAEIKYL
ncbi:MAG: YfcE family phosphodiesterase [Candidatus Goldbacteria bacterium]|nr:YfcE family phosphodiesterase [Candidatus Goldiibacteriota bacterium]